MFVFYNFSTFNLKITKIKGDILNIHFLIFWPLTSPLPKQYCETLTGVWRQIVDYISVNICTLDLAMSLLTSDLYICFLKNLNSPKPIISILEL